LAESKNEKKEEKKRKNLPKKSFPAHPRTAGPVMSIFQSILNYGRLFNRGRLGGAGASGQCEDAAGVLREI
jgi:hypothetical protein